MCSRFWPAALVAAALAATSEPARADISLNMYGNVNYLVFQQEGVTNQFAVPKISFLYSQSVGKLTIQAEVLAEADDTNNFGFDLDRLEIAYVFKDWIRLKIGRFHSSFGYYNDAYHHAAYFMVPISRPMIAEDSGDGLLPGFSVGLHLDGRVHLGSALALHYDVEVANTRGEDPDTTKSLYDLQNEKAVVARLRLEPGGALDGLVLGGNVALNWIPEGNMDPTRMMERIYGAHAVYTERNVHFISEFMWVEHQDRTSHHVYKTYGVFTELGYHIGTVTPYVRWERLKFLDPDKDPYYARVAHVAHLDHYFDSFDEWSAGVKVEIGENLALKAQAFATVYDANPNSYGGALQLAFQL